MQSRIDTAFIVCSPRTGSTLLTRILNSHSKIAAPFEIGLHSLFKGDQKEQMNLEKTYKTCQYYGLDFEKAKQDTLYFLREIISRERKQWIIIKDPRQSLFLPQIYSQFGDIPIIHLTRDVRAVCQSNMFTDNTKEGITRWMLFNESILENIELFSNYTRIKYEDIISDTIPAIARLLNLFQLQYEEGMEQYWKFNHTDDKLALWGSNTAKESKLHKNLYQQKISKNVSAISDDVERLYRSSAKTIMLNRTLGYDQ